MSENELMIRVQDVKKQYRLGQIGGGTLRSDLQSWWARKRGKEDPNTLIGTDQRLIGTTFMALNGVSFTVNKGEAVGIIGSNGAGKSTLLKLLTHVTAPTSGDIDLYGRVASMLEVGTGFNNEMTGRENIYMNGAILGMTRTEIDAKLLEKIADLTGKPAGAFNIRKDMGCEARQSTEHIAIDPRADGKPGIDIHFKAGTKGETCHIPVIISQTGMSDMVYNDFYVADDCDVNIVAGCGIHNSGCDESRHDGVHTFHIGRNCRVHYTEKHYGEDAQGETGKNVMNPQTIVYLGDNSTMQMDTVQIRGIDSTLRDTRFYCEAGSEVVVTERLLTHGDQTAESDMTIELNGRDARGRVISRSVAQDSSRQVFRPVMVGNSQCFGHVQCDSIIMGAAHIQSVPAITANCPDAQLIHEAAIGKIAGDQLLKLETLGLTPEEAEETILKGFLA